MSTTFTQEQAQAMAQAQSTITGAPSQIVINNYYGVNSAQLLEIFEAQRKQIETLLKLLPQVNITNTATATGNKTKSTSNANNELTATL